MWKNNAQRINANSVTQMLQNDALLIAEMDDNIVGCVNINMFDELTAEFGMLVADPNYRGIGIGSELVKAAESWALNQNRSVMRLEVLSPKNWEHPHKEFLKKWYTRIGYVLDSVEPFEKSHPDKINNLATVCEFTVYHKKLSKIG
jgi:GNAT superfamily N-acetyltransferase